MKKPVKPKKRVVKKPAAQSKKAVTARQQFNKDLQAFEQRVNEKLDAFRMALNHAMETQWKNIQYLNKSIEATEGHILMFRKLFDDLLNSCATLKEVPGTIRKLEDGKEVVTEIQAKTINWEYYAAWLMRAKKLVEQQKAMEQEKQKAESQAEKNDHNSGVKTTPVVDAEAAPVESIADVAHRLMDEAQQAAEDEAKKEGDLPPPDDGLPEGASVFGGDGGV